MCPLLRSIRTKGPVSDLKNRMEPNPMPVGFTEHGMSATCANQYLKIEFTFIRQNKFANLTHYYKFKQLRIKEITYTWAHKHLCISYIDYHPNSDQELFPRSTHRSWWDSHRTSHSVSSQ